ncbi:ASCH domain-containing protein [Sphingobium lactosutens]|uniref:ASCH domain-containing protein n=1 Tax=Sphingobium lactosutens TaxID=522773 RepID=UPI00137662A8|nr:ASCH domain-containing protein [Sphingobium lactosutens]
MTTANEAIISIHPRHAHAILDGAKTIELRRRIPSVSIGTRLWIYATRPLGAVIGVAIVERIVRGDPEAIWLKFGHQTGVERWEYDAYFDGAQEAIALVLTQPQRNVKHVAIEHLRNLRQGFHPPQVLTWISCEEARSLRQMATVG